MRKSEFRLDDFMAQMAQAKKLGPMSKVMGMIPGMAQMTKQMKIGEGDIEKQMARMRGIYDSMNVKERENPDTLDAYHRRRIANGAGVTFQEISQFIKQFEMSRSMMQNLGSSGMVRKFKPVLGLVTDDPSHRDPSCVRPVSQGARRRTLLRWILLAALCFVLWRATR